jgi:hypothetical protein
MRVKAQLFPYENVDVEASTCELESKGFVQRCKLPDGRVLLYIMNWSKHQRPHQNEAQSEFPSLEEALATLDEGLAQKSEALALEPRTLNLEPCTNTPLPPVTACHDSSRDVTVGNAGKDSPLAPPEGGVVAVAAPAQEPRRKRKPRLTVDEPGPYAPEIVSMVLRLREVWPTARGPKAEPMHNDNYHACANIARILADHRSVDLEMLEKSAEAWLDTRPSYPNDIQNYFGPGKAGTTPPWLREYRGYVTHLELAAGDEHP